MTTADFRRAGPSFKEHKEWKGEAATNSSKRDRAARRFPIKNGEKCERCNIKNQHDRCHLDGNLDNIEPENIIKVCRRCCMELDGRLDLFRHTSPPVKSPLPCVICRQLRKPLRKGRCHSCNEYYRRHKKDKNLDDLDCNGNFRKKEKVFKACVICNNIKQIKLKSGKCHACYERHRKQEKKYQISI